MTRFRTAWSLLDPALARLLRINMLSLGGATLSLAVAYLLGFRHPAVVLDLAVMAAALVLQLAPLLLVERFGATAPVAGLAASVAAFGVVGTWTTPNLVALTVLLTGVPLLVGFPYVSRRWVVGLMVFAVIGSSGFAALAEWRRDHVNDASLVNALVAAAFVPFGLVVLLYLVHNVYQRMLTQSVQLRESSTRVVQVADAARRGLERDLHDGAQQRLLAMTVDITRARKAIREDDGESAAELLGQLYVATHEVLAEIRELARGLYPPLLAERGLVAAVKAAARRSPVPVTVLVDPFERRPDSVEAAAYFCILEAMNNATKYSGEAEVRVVITADPKLEFVVSDDGVGFDAARVEWRGLLGMEARMRAAGGTLKVTSTPGLGTVVRGRFPV